MNDSENPFEFEDELDRMKARKSRRQQQGSRRTEYETEDAWDEFDLYDEADSRQPDRKKKRDSSAKPPAKEASGKRKKKRRWIPILFLLLMIGLIGYGYSIWKNADSGYWTVAVFGIDKNNLSDVQLICNVNRETGEIRLLSVFRDTYVQIDEEGTYHKLNEAYFRGGSKQGLYALKTNLDIDIDDYAAFNWKAVADTINILGGIDLEITDKEFAYINSFITETVESTGIGSVHLTQSGMNHLDGVQAVAYCRLRLMDTDFQRTQRQRKVIGLAMEKAKKADIGVLNNIVVTILPQLSTDINAADLIALAKNIDKYYIGETSGFPFAHEQAKISGRDCVIPATLESNVIQLHSFLFDIEDYSPSQTVKTISKKIIADTGVGSVGTDTESGRDQKGSSGTGSSQNIQAPGETQAPAAASPAETSPETIEEITDDGTIEAETETSETLEIPETIQIPETPETEADTPPQEIGPGVGIEQTAPEIPQPEPGEKPTMEEVGPGVSME